MSTAAGSVQSLKPQARLTNSDGLKLLPSPFRPNWATVFMPEHLGNRFVDEFNITKIRNSIRLKKKLYLPHALIATVFILAKLMQAG